MTETRPSSSPESNGIDRHHGWYTEFPNDPRLEIPMSKRSADYVVRTSLFREPQPMDQSGTKRKNVNLVLRLRSLLPPRSRALGGKTHRRHSSTPFESGQGDGPHRRCSMMELVSKQLNRTSATPSTLPLSRSDVCLTRTPCHPEFNLMHSHFSPVNETCPLRAGARDPERVMRAPRSQIDNRDWSTSMPDRMYSLSTGNVCCLFTLRCLPSMECINATRTRAYSPSARRQSMPTSSLKYHTDEESELCPGSKVFALSLLKQHPCYKDVHCNLGDWVKKTLNRVDDTDTGQSTDQGRTSRHGSSRLVRFADETNLSSSTTTLNSLSASSSTRSLASIATNIPAKSVQESFPVTAPPFTCGTTVNMHPLCRKIPQRSGSLRESMKNLKLSDSVDEDVASLDSGSKSSSSNFITPHRNSHQPNKDLCKSASTETSHFKEQHPCWRKKSKRKTPLVTVNVIRDQSEPPEVPSHVLNALSAAAYEPRWKSTVANPIECANFYKRLAVQRVCLARLLSKSLSHLEVEVHTAPIVPLHSGGNCTVQMRYTLDNWITYKDSPPLTCLRVEKKLISVYDTLCVEVYVVQLSVECSKLGPDLKTARFEFAISSRQEGQSECWDNNDGENYVCVVDSKCD
ncbi:unnamed protein product [Dicrocoelium dendriticum]|nr:unnamed protein product [Dicrocoelium dendriticum]